MLRMRLTTFLVFCLAPVVAIITAITDLVARHAIPVWANWTIIAVSIALLCWFIISARAHYRPPDPYAQFWAEKRRREGRRITE